MMETKLSELDAKTDELRHRELNYSHGRMWIVQNFHDKLDLSWIYHDNALEGIVLSYSELKAAIDKKIISDVTLIPTYEEIKNHKVAIEHVRELAKKRKLALTLEGLRRFYDILAPEDEGKPNAFRRENPLHRLYYHEIAPPDKIIQRLRKLVEWLDSDEFRQEHPVKRAALAHYRLLAIYPWMKNSGKVARLLMNLLLLRDGYLPVVIHSIDRQRYYEVLRSEHAGCVPLVVESLLNGVDTALKFFAEVDNVRSRVAS